MPFAARLSDNHECPGVYPQPHVGGPITGPCASTVFIGGRAAARVGDELKCMAEPDRIVSGSSSVLIERVPAARKGDATLHGGFITEGCDSVEIGS